MGRVTREMRRDCGKNVEWGFSPAITSPRIQNGSCCWNALKFGSEAVVADRQELPWDSRAVCPRSGRNYIKCLELCQRRATRSSSPG